MARGRKTFEYERRGSTLVVVPTGDSLGFEERDLESEIAGLHDLLDDPELQNVVVDVGRAPYFSSLVLGAVLALCKRATDRGGQAALCNASAGMLESIQIMKLDRVLPYYSTRDEALQAAGDS